MNLTNKQIENLYHTSCKGFYDKEKKTCLNRFELIEGKIKNSYKDSTMYWFDNQIESLIAFNYYRKKYPYTLHLWDMAKNGKIHGQFCILVNKPYK